MSVPWPSTRIFFRIVLPFTFLFTAVTLVTWATSVFLVGHYFEAGLKRQLVRVAQGVSQSAFLLNPMILRQVKGIVDAEIVLSNGEGQVLSSTIDDDALGQAITEIIAMNNGRYTASSNYETHVKGNAYRGVFLELSSNARGQAYLSLWQSTATARAFKRSIVMLTASLALLGIAALTLAGFFIARSISIPVVQLARITERVASGDYQSRATVRGEDEIAMLGDSFNKMIDRLQDSEKKLVEAGKLAAAGQLAAGVAHEIRNPLTAIKMFVQVLQGRMQTEPRNMETLAILLKEIDRLDRIVEQIVQRARADEGIQQEMTDLVALLDEVLLLSQESLRAARIEVHKDVSAGLPQIALDRAKIKQVFWNLITNARDTMPQGGDLRITARQALTPAMVELVFADTGAGLAGLEPEACFAPFFTTKPEGLGLGLSMSRKIVNRHGGSLTLRPGPQGGAEAVVLLPG